MGASLTTACRHSRRARHQARIVRQSAVLAGIRTVGPRFLTRSHPNTWNKAITVIDASNIVRKAPATVIDAPFGGGSATLINRAWISCAGHTVRWVHEKGLVGRTGERVGGAISVRIRACPPAAGRGAAAWGVTRGTRNCARLVSGGRVSSRVCANVRPTVHGVQAFFTAHIVGTRPARELVRAVRWKASTTKYHAIKVCLPAGVVHARSTALVGRARARHNACNISHGYHRPCGCSGRAVVAVAWVWWLFR